jgi:S1-C subfamily serine protease
MILPEGTPMDKKVISFSILLALLPLFLIDPAAPQVYRYKDKNGVVHFTDTPPDGKYTRLQEERFVNTQFPYYGNNPLIDAAPNKLEWVSRAVIGVKTAKMGGSGFLINPAGYAVTNYHVIAEAGGDVKAITFDGREWNARVITDDPDKDLALIHLGNGGYPYLPLGKLTDVSVGKEVYTIGNPLGLSHSVSKGIVSSVRKGMKKTTPVTLIQTDAAINAGNSGGPLITPEGLVLGVVTFKAGTPHFPVQGIGFAVSSEDIIGSLSLVPAKKETATPQK